MVVSSPSPDDGEPPGSAGPDDGRREPTMTLAGWRRFVDAPPASFDLLPDRRWTALPAGDRQAYDEARLSYHSEMIIVATTAVREVARQGRLLTLLNRREVSARRGLIVSGQQTTGKTTALKQLGRTHELLEGGGLAGGLLPGHDQAAAGADLPAVQQGQQPSLPGDLADGRR